jgi:hypothetical protein
MEKVAMKIIKGNHDDYRFPNFYTFVQTWKPFNAKREDEAYPISVNVYREFEINDKVFYHPSRAFQFRGWIVGREDRMLFGERGYRYQVKYQPYQNVSRTTWTMSLSGGQWGLVTHVLTPR